MQLLGIDPSLTATGVATGQDTYTVKSKRDGDARLLDLYLRVFDWAVRADFAAVEDLPTHAQGAGKTGMAQGVVRLALLNCDTEFVVVPPACLKKYATGKGNATKPDMRMALYQRMGLDLRDDNQVDAWWLRAMLCDALGEPVVQLPKTHRDTLAKVTWPRP